MPCNRSGRAFQPALRRLFAPKKIRRAGFGARTNGRMQARIVGHFAGERATRVLRFPSSVSPIPTRARRQSTPSSRALMSVHSSGIQKSIHWTGFPSRRASSQLQRGPCFVPSTEARDLANSRGGDDETCSLAFLMTSLPSLPRSRQCAVWGAQISGGHWHTLHPKLVSPQHPPSQLIHLSLIIELLTIHVTIMCRLLASSRSWGTHL